MSLTSAVHEDGHGATPKVILRTADQYHLWRARTSAACWAATRMQIFDITDDECGRATKAWLESDRKSIDWVGRCWQIITTSLHDELFLKLIHVEQGRIATLMSEIRSALLVNIAEDVQPLRLELYAASMSGPNCDLQSYISFIFQRRDKLLFLEVKIPEEELIHVFLKGLHPVFQPLQVHFAIPGALPTTLDKAVEIARKFSASPIVHAELAKLKKNPSVSNSRNLEIAVMAINVVFPTVQLAVRIWGPKGKSLLGT